MISPDVKKSIVKNKAASFVNTMAKPGDTLTEGLKGLDPKTMETPFQAVGRGIKGALSMIPGVSTVGKAVNGIGNYFKENADLNSQAVDAMNKKYNSSGGWADSPTNMTELNSIKDKLRTNKAKSMTTSYNPTGDLVNKIPKTKLPKMAPAQNSVPMSKFSSGTTLPYNKPTI